MFDTLFEKLAHLPVSQICDNVAEYYANQMIPIVTSEVASGKTMLIPAACALALKDDPIDQVVYVLEPTRFLSNNAAESLWSLLGEDRHLVGVLNSNRSDDDSTLHPDNRLVFTTVGYALAAGILTTKSNFIFDEAHETSIDLSLAKAYLHARLKRGDLINLAELSATIDVENELTYWGDNAIAFTTKGSAFPVEFLHRPAFSLAAAVSELVSTYDRKGILVFVSGVEEIEDAVAEISAAMHRDAIDFEIETVHGNSSGPQRKAASRDRQASVKILVGTNVLESGVSLPWVDGGVSSGDTKVMYARGNVRRLHKEELPRWRIEQQRGRVGRFKPGVFTLADKNPLTNRPEMAEADIVRLPLTELVMNCTKYPDIHIRDLEFTPREQPQEGAITDAIATLVNYGLISENEDGQISLTDDGRLVNELPLSYRAAAAVCEANKLNMIGEMLPLIAAIDMGDLRFDYRVPMFGASWRSSDTVAQIMVIIEAVISKEHKLKRRRLTEIFEENNIHSKKYYEYRALVEDLERKTGRKAQWNCYLPATDEAVRDEFDRLTKQVIFRAMIVESYPFTGYDVIIPKTESKGSIFRSAQPSNTTLTIQHDGLFLTGDIRIVTPKPKMFSFSSTMPFAVIEQITVFTEKDVRNLIKVFGRSALEKITAITVLPTPLSDFLSGKSRDRVSSDATLSGILNNSPATSGYYSDSLDYAKARRLQPGSISDDYNLERSHGVEKTVLPVENSEPTMGTLGSLLSEALNRKK